TAYSLAWLIYLTWAKVDSLADFPYDPKRVLKVDYALLQLTWGFLTYLPLAAEENIFYGSQHESNRLDVYKPDEVTQYSTAGGRKLSPVVVFVHGGGWCT
ncbi:2515_t:CDS:2, partial [Paraglomus occultum]